MELKIINSNKFSNTMERFGVENYERHSLDDVKVCHFCTYMKAHPGNFMWIKDTM